MKVATLACLLLNFAVGTLTAQSAPSQQEIRVLSIRWAEYYAAVYRVPVDLVVAIIDEESGWNPYAVSEKGAVGLMQLMPQTALQFGVRNRFRADENIRGGVAYPISRRKLDYSSADVQGYVKRVAKRYRAKRRRAVNLPVVNGHGDEK